MTAVVLRGLEGTEAIVFSMLMLKNCVVQKISLPTNGRSMEILRVRGWTPEILKESMRLNLGEVYAGGGGVRTGRLLAKNLP